MTVSRLECIVVGRARQSVPAFFPSISTVKTALLPGEYLATLHALRDVSPQFLVSAFDLARTADLENAAGLLAAAQDAGTTVLMDSGNYESYWKDEQAAWRQADFHDALQRFPCTFAFGFDNQSPPADMNEHVELIIDRWHQDQAVTNRSIVPIVHGSAIELPSLCTQVARAAQVPMIAVAERRLGNGVFERTKSVQALRAALDNTGRYVGLHLLGTGNPISIALYAWAGADSFDGLEWCQTVVDHDTALLFHLSQADFFQHQTVWGEEELSFQARTLAHNLAFYADWMRRLRSAVHGGDAVSFCRFNFPPRLFERCSAAFGWEAAA